MKRTPDDLDNLDDFDDFDETDDEEETIEPQPKRLRNESSIAKEEGSTEKDGQTEEKDIADKVVELLAPRIKLRCNS